MTWSLIAQAGDAAETAATETAWYQSGLFVFVLLLALLAGCWYIGHWIGSTIRLKEYSTRLSVIITCILLGALIVGKNWPPKFGVDLRGGMNLIGSLDLEKYNVDDDPLLASGGIEAKDIIPQLLKRVDPSGTKEIMIRPLGEDKIEVTIPDVDAQEAREIWNRLAKAGHLKFRIVADATYPEHREVMNLAEAQNANGSQSRNVYQLDGDGNRITETVQDAEGNDVQRDVVLARWYGLARKDSEDQVQVDLNEILDFKFVPTGNNLVRDATTGTIIDMSTVPLGNDPDGTGEALARWASDRGIRTLQILMMEPESEDSNVEGDHIASTRPGRDEYGGLKVTFKMTDEGTGRMGMLTTLNKPDSNDRKKLLGIVLDEQLHSAPSINSPIYDSGEITGSFTQQEIDDLIINLRSGKLKVALNKNPISEQFIESHLGNELKTKGLYSIGISFLLVLVFMIFYYRFAGWVACGALFINLLLILALVMAIQQPLTLTGLAGLVLTIGMSVDANVLIFERIREELERGSGLRMAINNGFDKATTTIVDANVTTLITALVLYVIGTEQIKGFSVTLILGILMSMFTAIYCSRTVFLIAERKRWLTKLNMMRALARTKFDFLGKRMITGAFSVVLIISGIAGMWFLGGKILNHDLRGGSTARMVFTEAPADGAETIRAALDQITSIEGLDEELEFTVSKLTDDNYPDCVFKIDSNLPTYDGEGTPPYMNLAQLLTQTFEGQLTMLSVKVGDMTVIGPDGEPVSSNEPADIERSIGQLQVPTVLDALTLLSPTSMIVQEEGSEEAAGGEEAGGDQDIFVDGDADDAQDDSSAGEAGNDDGAANQEESGDETPAETGAEETGPPANDAEQAVEDIILPSGGDFQGAPEININARNKVKVNLEFGQTITGKALRTILSESAANQSIELTEEQIEVDSPDMGAEDTASSFPSTNWEVTFDLSSEADVNSILSGWSEQYNATPYFPTTSGVGGQIASDTQWQALGAIVASLLGIIAYVWIRFQNVAFGLAAVVALIHDVLIVLGAIALSHFVADYLGILGIENFKISLPVVAALLTIIGYSLNDTIVVFDRIREVRGKRQEITEEMINTSICQTLSRTILTSLTTFIVVFILYAFGGDAIHGFAFSLVIGVIVGTYSSIFVASPTLLWLMNSVGLNPGAVAVATDEK